MAIRTGIIGTLRKKAGDARFSLWKGKNIVAQMPASYNDANTPAQQANRRKLRLLAQLSKALRQAIMLGFKNSAQTVTEYNRFFQSNYAIVTDDGTNATIDLTQVKLSEGPLMGILGFNVSAGPDEGEITLTIPNTADNISGFNSDRVHVFAYNPVTKAFGKASTTPARSDINTPTQLQFPQTLWGTSCHIYAFFVSEDGSMISATKYIGLLNLPS